MHIEVLSQLHKVIDVLQPKIIKKNLFKLNIKYIKIITNLYKCARVHVKKAAMSLTICVQYSYAHIFASFDGYVNIT